MHMCTCVKARGEPRVSSLVASFIHTSFCALMCGWSVHMEGRGQLAGGVGCVLPPPGLGDGTQVIWVSIKHLHLLGNLHSLLCENQVENTEFSSLLDPVYGNTDSTKSESLNIKNVSSD